VLLENPTRPKDMEKMNKTNALCDFGQVERIFQGGISSVNDSNGFSSEK